MMDEIARAINSYPTGRHDMEKFITDEVAEVVFGSNQFERLGVDLDETLRLCLLVFSGQEGLEKCGEVCQVVYSFASSDVVGAQP